MEMKINRLLTNNADKQNKLLFCIIVTFIFGMVAHAYQFFHSSFSHDSLDSIFSDSTEMRWKIALGRFVVPIISKFRGQIAAPWLIGFLALFLIALSVFIIVEIFDVDSKLLIASVSGIMVTNLTVTATAATYLYELDYDMLALALSSLSAFLLSKKTNIFYWFLSVITILLSLGVYQSYIEVTVALLIIFFVKDLFGESEAAKVFVQGLKSIAAIVSGMILYYGLNKLICIKFDVIGEKRTDLFGGQENSLLLNFKIMISKVINVFANPVSIYNVRVMGLIDICLISIGVFLSLYLIFKFKKSFKEVILSLVLLAALPLSINIISFVVDGVVHELMIYSFWLIYIFSLLMTDYVTKKTDRKAFGYLRITAFVLTGLIIWNNIAVANTAYLKKDLENTATVSTMTRVVDDLEERDDYEVGKTEISFIGSISTIKTMPGFEFLSDTTGLRGCGSISQSGISEHYNLYKAFFNYYLNYPLNYSKTDFSKDERVKSMPTYPEKGYIQNIDGVLVVKMG